MELLTVLVVIGILAGLGLTAMNHIGRAQALQNGARQFANDINMARNYAVVNSTYLYLVVATDSTTNAPEIAYSAYGFCVPVNTNTTQAVGNLTNVVYVEDLAYLPRGVVFSKSGTNNVTSQSISFPTTGTNLAVRTAWVVTFTPNGQILPLSRRPYFELFEGIVDSSGNPVRTAGATNSFYRIEINPLIGKPSVTKLP